MLASNLVTEVKEATGGRGVNLVLDPLGGALRAQSLDVRESPRMFSSLNRDSRDLRKTSSS